MKMTVGFSGFRNNPFTNLITTSLNKTPEYECSVNKNQDFIMHLRDWYTMVHWTILLITYFVELVSYEVFIYFLIFIFFSKDYFIAHENYMNLEFQCS